MAQVGQTEPATSREPLSRERVLETAVALADRHGLEWLSMRKLAEELGVAAMSLYYYVPNKDELIDGMIDIVFGEIEPPPPELDWKAAMRGAPLDPRGAQPPPLGGRPDGGAHRPRAGEPPAPRRGAGCLRAAGFSLEMTVHAYSVQDAYIYGFALQETDMSQHETSDDFAAEAQRQMEAYADALKDYPHLVEVVGGHVAQVGYDYAKEFLFGLDLILDGLDRLRS